MSLATSDLALMSKTFSASQEVREFRFLIKNDFKNCTKHHPPIFPVSCRQSLPGDRDCSQNNSSYASNQSSNVNATTSKENYSGPLCRMILPDQSTTVVPLVPGESIRTLISRLLEKKGLRYSATDVYTINSNVVSRFQGRHRTHGHKLPFDKYKEKLL
jgi:hypothetical protein